MRMDCEPTLETRLERGRVWSHFGERIVEDRKGITKLGMLDSGCLNRVRIFIRVVVRATHLRRLTQHRYGVSMVHWLVLCPVKWFRSTPTLLTVSLCQCQRSGYTEEIRLQSHAFNASRSKPHSHTVK